MHHVSSSHTHKGGLPEGGLVLHRQLKRPLPGVPAVFPDARLASCHRPPDRLRPLRYDVLANTFCIHLCTHVRASNLVFVFMNAGWYPWYGPIGRELGNVWRIGPDTSSWDRIL